LSSSWLSSLKIVVVSSGFKPSYTALSSTFDPAYAFGSKKTIGKFLRIFFFKKPFFPIFFSPFSPGPHIRNRDAAVGAIIRLSQRFIVDVFSWLESLFPLGLSIEFPFSSMAFFSDFSFTYFCLAPHIRNQHPTVGAFIHRS
jgi:hypothetical protein